MTIILTFLKKTPNSTTPMFSLFILPSYFPLLLSLVYLLVLQSKKQFQITANSMALLHSMAPAEETEKERSTKNHDGWKSGTTRSPACVLKRGSETCSQQLSLPWLGEQEGRLHRHLCWNFWKPPRPQRHPYSSSSHIH